MITQPQPLVVGPVRIVNPTGRTVSPLGAIVVEGDRVVAIVDGDEARPGTAGWCGEEGAWAVPGLIDMHVHTASYRTSNTGRPKRSAAMTAVLAAQNLAVAAACGVTTVRDLGSPGRVGFDVAAAWREGFLLGARPVVAGPMLCAPGGHGSASGIALEVTDAASIRAAIARLVRAGSEVVKLAMASVARPVRLPPAVLSAAIEEARARSMPVAVHANFDVESVEAAVLAGCTSLEHGCVFALLPEVTRVAFGRAGGAICPTLSVLRHVLTAAEEFRLAGAGRFVDQVEAGWELAQESVAVAYAEGVAVLAGTDAGVGRHPFASLVDELDLLAACGIDDWDVLASATVTAARVLGRPDLGQLAADSPADFVLLDGNPVINRAHLRDPSGVCLAGRFLDRSWQRAVRASAAPAAGRVLGCCGP